MEGSAIAVQFPVWVKWLLPIIGPVIVAAIKAALKQYKDRIPAFVWPILCMVITTALGALGLSVDLTDLGVSALAGLAGSKGRDIVVGLAEAC